MKIHPVIHNNTFTDTARPIQIMPWRNNGAGSEYAITNNEVNNTDLTLMLQNHLVRVGETFIRVNGTYDVFTSNTQKLYYSQNYIR